ncbi:hypothetical protein PG988_007459 [Apiospora saccharicola]
MSLACALRRTKAWRKSCCGFGGGYGSCAEAMWPGGPMPVAGMVSVGMVALTTFFQMVSV